MARFGDFVLSRYSKRLRPSEEDQPTRQEIENTLDYLQSRNVSQFVHFTPIENLKSILEHGLLPRDMLLKQGGGSRPLSRMILDSMAKTT